MRPQIVKKILLSILLHISLIGYAFVNEKQPPTPYKARGPSFPELSIDNNLIILFITGLVYGVVFLIIKKFIKSQPR